MAMWSTFWFVLFLVFAVYAVSAIRVIRQVPLRRPVLVAIAVIYAVRGLAIVPQLVWFDFFPVTRARDVVFSALSILLALAYAVAARPSRPTVAA